MKKIIERIVASEAAPGHYDLWIDTNNETPELKINFGYEKNSGWKTIGGSGGDSGGDSDGGSSVMLVKGTYSQVGAGSLSFSPALGEPTWEEAYAHIARGGLLYFVIEVDGVPAAHILAISALPEAIIGLVEQMILWSNPGHQSPE